MIPPPALYGKHCGHQGIYVPLLALGENKKKCFSYRLFYNSFPVLPFLSLLHNSWYFSQTGPLSEASPFPQIPIFHDFHLFLFTCTNRGRAWGNQAATVTCKPQACSCGTCMICQFSEMFLKFSGGKRRSRLFNTEDTSLFRSLWEHQTSNRDFLIAPQIIVAIHQSGGIYILYCSVSCVYLRVFIVLCCSDTHRCRPQFHSASCVSVSCLSCCHLFQQSVMICMFLHLITDILKQQTCNPPVYPHEICCAALKKICSRVYSLNEWAVG